MTDAQLIEASRMWLRHMNTNQIAKALGVEEWAVYNRIGAIKQVESLPEHFREASAVMRERLVADRA